MCAIYSGGAGVTGADEMVSSGFDGESEMP